MQKKKVSKKETKQLFSEQNYKIKKFFTQKISQIECKNAATKLKEKKSLFLRVPY